MLTRAKRLPVVAGAILIAGAGVALMASLRWLGPLQDAATRVVFYVPPPALVARLEAHARPGACWTHSIAAPYRQDAWRCLVGNAIADPCFEAAPTGGGPEYLLCGANPADPAAAHTFDLRLTRPLPRGKSTAAAPHPDAAAAWLVQLADGRLCRPFTGTRPFASSGVVAEFGCGPLPGDESPTYIFGGLNRNPRTWTAKTGTLRQAGRRLPSLGAAHTTAIAAVWR